MKPTKVEFSLGKTAHNQPVRLVWEYGSWTLHRDAANQRDESEAVRGLTDENLLAMSEAVKARGQ